MTTPPKYSPPPARWRAIAADLARHAQTLAECPTMQADAQIAALNDIARELRADADDYEGTDPHAA